MNPAQAARLRSMQYKRKTLNAARKAKLLEQKYGANHPAAKAASDASLKHLQATLAEDFKYLMEKGKVKEAQKTKSAFQLLAWALEEEPRKKNKGK